MFLSVQLTISQHCLFNGLALNLWQAIAWIDFDEDLSHIMISLGHSELNCGEIAQGMVHVVSH